MSSFFKFLRAASSDERPRISENTVRRLRSGATLAAIILGVALALALARPAAA